MRVLQRWDDKLSSCETTEVLLHLSELLLRDTLPSEQADSIRHLVKSGDIAGLCSFELCYDTLDVDSSSALRQVLAFFQKRQDIELLVDKSAEAWEKFVDSELLCYETNEVFRKIARGGFNFPLDVEPALLRAQRKIDLILGPCPSLDELKLRFGPGATTQVKKKDASVRRKLAQMYCCSGELESRLPEILAECPKWVFGETNAPDSTFVSCQVQPGRVDFARKSAKTDRTIAVEPMLNQMVQLGIGDYIASQLRGFGIDTRNQARNQSLAKIGSLTGALATLDLSSASDTIATELVMSLLPLEWTCLLGSCRTRTQTTPDGDYVMLEKFSTMGNGFTFALETLIFYALACACTEGSLEQVSVYGDDIIVPTDSVPLLTKVLTCCGFLVNKSKSFSSGPFRESCGADYFSGIDVRPVYVKDVFSGESLFVLHNSFVRKGLLHLAQSLLCLLSKEMKIWGPDGYGDGHLLGVIRMRRHNQELGWSGFTFDTYTWKSPKAFYSLGADYVFPSYSIYIRSSGPLGTDSDSDRLTSAKSAIVSSRVREDLGVARYEKKGGKEYLVDSLPGTDGYKRIKIYVLA